MEVQVSYMLLSNFFIEIQKPFEKMSAKTEFNRDLESFGI